MSLRTSLRTLRVDRVVMHEVPQREPGEAADTDRCVLSYEETMLNEQTRLYFVDRLRTSLNSSMSREVVFLQPEHTESPIPGHVSTYLQHPAACDLVVISQECARYLFRCQNRVNPAGIFAMVVCRAENRPAVGLMKLEREAGIQYNSVEINGRRTLELEIRDNLVLTEKGKVFKVGLFRGADGGPEGLVSDNQMTRAGGDVAKFYLERFLGARFVVSPELATRRFSEATTSFINAEIVDNLEKSEVYGHLVSELARDSTTISPRTFARECIPESVQDTYLDFISERGVPDGTFDKDLGTARSKALQLSYAFTQGLRVVGPEEAFRQTFSIEPLEGERVRASIEDSIKKLGRG